MDGRRVVITRLRQKMRKPDGNFPVSPMEYLQVVNNPLQYLEDNHPEHVEAYRQAVASRTTFFEKFDQALKK